jgi:hypothetical protein
MKMTASDKKTVRNINSDTQKTSTKTTKNRAAKTKKTTATRASTKKLTTKQKTAAVEDALYRRAIGYSADELVFAPEDESGERCIKIVRKEVAPSIQAQIQWLKAYKPEVWKNGSDTEPSDPALLYKALTGGGNSGNEDDV